MSRYRKVHVKIWNHRDELSDDGMLVLFHVLTNRHSNSIGLYVASPVMLNEEMGWTQKRYRKAFDEVVAAEIINYDDQRRVIYIPVWFEYNPPQSVNAVKSWSTQYDEIPNCPAKAECYQQLKAFLEGMSQGFRDAFADGFAKPKGMPTVQKQKQEQKQKQNPARAREVGFDSFWDLYPRKVGKKEARKAWVAMAKGDDSPGLASLLEAVKRAKQSDQWAKDGGQFIPYPATWLRRGGWMDEVTTDTGANHPTVQAIIEELRKGDDADYQVMKQLACDVVTAGQTVPQGAAYWINTHMTREDARAELRAEGYPVER